MSQETEIGGYAFLRRKFGELKFWLTLADPDGHHPGDDRSRGAQFTMTLLSMLLLGFFLGVRHASDSDHVIAISTIVSRQRHLREAVVTGVYWGLGHSVTLFCVGGAIILFGIVIPERLGLSFEFCVALMLIFLGILNLRAASVALRNAHGKVQGRPIHEHRSDRPLRSTLVGITHGLAGSGAIALLVLPIMPGPIWGMMYLAIFSIGTIIGMIMITAAMVVPVSYASSFRFLNRHLGTTAGIVSLIFGLFLVYQIGFVDGLFR